MKTYCVSLLFVILGLVVLNVEAAVSIQVTYKDQQYRVIDVKRNQPVIQVEDKRRTISRSKIGMNKQDRFSFKDGYFELKDRQIRSRSQSSSSGGGQFNSRLFFKAQIRTSVDLENCFIVIELIPHAGESRIVLAELKDFKANKWTKVEFSVPTIKSLGGGKAKHYIFSGGVQVLPKRQFEQAGQGRVENTAIRSQIQDRPPQIIAP